jgi:hypothetical protein
MPDLLVQFGFAPVSANEQAAACIADEWRTLAPTSPTAPMGRVVPRKICASTRWRIARLPSRQLCVLIKGELDRSLARCSA